MDTKVKGIVLSCKDYGEKDKLVTILTFEKGKILCKARGIKSPKSKLKMMVQPFCFADFELVSSNAGYTLAGGNIIDSFFDIVSDIDKFEHGYAILEMLDKISKENQDISASLIFALKILKELCYSELSPKLLFIYFALNIFKEEGFEINLERCSVCKSKFTKDIYLNLSTGEMLCKQCLNYDSIAVPPAVFSTMRLVGQASLEGLKNLRIKDEYMLGTISLLKRDFEQKFMCKLRGLSN